MPSISRQCRLSGRSFVVTEEDQALLTKLGMPLPTLCPEERQRRRLAYRNERHLYHRKCDLTGMQMISSISPSKPYPVYSIDAWWSDDWDPLEYGRDYDFNRPFFEQWQALRDAVPRMALQQQKPMQNSEYCNCASRSKNCYLVFSTNECEDCYYGTWINFSRDCVDNTNALRNELCYETVDCEKGYNLIYAEESVNCTDSAFIKNCIGVRNCLFSTNLSNAEYHIFNKPFSKEEYERFKSELKLNTYSGLRAAIERFEEFKKTMFVKATYGTQNENVTGNVVSRCKNSFHVYESSDCEDVRYANNVEVKVKDCMDYSYWGQGATEVYESMACGYDVYRLRFCNLCWSNCSNLAYCDHCFSTKDSFGCVGLKRAQYCILNKQYSQEEYESLLPRIVEHMKSTGAWGEFFPIERGPYAYNETVAQEWFPLTRDEALVRDYAWEESNKQELYQGPVVELSDAIEDVSDEVTKQILRCEVTGELYKIIPQELQFYRKMGLPVPRRSPNQRHRDRMARRNPRQLWDRECPDCGAAMQTSYAPGRPERVLCEGCYLKAVY